MPHLVLARVIQALAQTLDALLGAYFWIVLIAVLISWVNPDPRNPIVNFLYAVTDPVLSWIRRRMPFLIVGSFDLSPIVLLLGIRVVQSVLVGSLHDLAYQLAGAGSLRVP
jgi:YggT family protein